jgi:hypothetical protein
MSIIGNHKKGGVKKFILQLFLLLALVWAVDFIIGNILRHFFFKQESGHDYETIYSMEKTRAEVLIFGSSKGSRQYYPAVFENRLGMSYYNASREGYFMLYHEAVLKAIVKRHKPKIIVLDIRADEFIASKETYEELSCLLPFYKTHPEVRPIIDLRGKYEKLKLFSNIYPFNSLIFKIVAGNAEFNKKRHKTINGYMPFDDVWTAPIKPFEGTAENKTDTAFIKSYEAFINICREKKIQLFIVTTPYLNKLHLYSPSIDIAKKTAAKNNIPFIDYSLEPALINHPELFADPKHLNNNGAKIMSNMLVDSILKYSASGM